MCYTKFGDCMKKIIFFLIVLTLLTGCVREKEKKEEVKEEKIEEVQEEVMIPEWTDDNHTPISFYSLSGNTLTRVNHVSGSYAALDDIGLFQVYPSTEEVIHLNNGFPSSYHDELKKYMDLYHVKVGFSLDYTLKDGTNIHHNIFSPHNAMDHWEYFMAYLYDDYHNMGKSFYSHIEPEEYSEDSLLTAIKLQLGDWEKLGSPVTFQVFTYNSDDDFLDGHYRGDSSSTITICINGLC